jgi:hypothetical protein
MSIANLKDKIMENSNDINLNVRIKITFISKNKLSFLKINEKINLAFAGCLIFIQLSNSIFLMLY